MVYVSYDGVQYLGDTLRVPLLELPPKITSPLLRYPLSVNGEGDHGGEVYFHTSRCLVQLGMMDSSENKLSSDLKADLVAKRLNAGLRWRR